MRPASGRKLGAARPPTGLLRRVTCCDDQVARHPTRSRVAPPAERGLSEAPSRRIRDPLPGVVLHRSSATPVLAPPPRPAVSTGPTQSSCRGSRSRSAAAQLRRSLGSTRPAPVRRTRTAPRTITGAPATSTTRASSPCSPGRPRGRGRAPSAARVTPVRRARSSRSSRCWCARSGPGSRPTRPSTRAAARRAAQAARRRRHDPGQDRRPRHLAARAARRGRRGLRRGAARYKRDMLRAAGLEPPPRSPSRARAGRPRGRPPSAGSCRSR